MGAAMVMAVSMMGVGASAAESPKTWGVRYYPQAPTSVNVKLCQNKLLADSGSITYVRESCTSYSSEQTNNGTVAYVKYWAYTIDSNGDFVGRGFINHTHYRTQSTHLINLVKATPENYVLIVKHELQNSTIRSSMSGTIGK